MMNNSWSDRFSYAGSKMCTVQSRHQNSGVAWISSRRGQTFRGPKLPLSKTSFAGEKGPNSPQKVIGLGRTHARSERNAFHTPDGLIQVSKGSDLGMWNLARPETVRCRPQNVSCLKECPQSPNQPSFTYASYFSTALGMAYHTALRVPWRTLSGEGLRPAVWCNFWPIYQYFGHVLCQLWQKWCEERYTKHGTYWFLRSIAWYWFLRSIRSYSKHEDWDLFCPFPNRVGFKNRTTITNKRLEDYTI